MTSEERHENNARRRRNNQSRPARYVNGVRLSDEEVANISLHKSQKKPNVKNEKMKLSGKQQQLRNQLRLQ